LCQADFSKFESSASWALSCLMSWHGDFIARVSPQGGPMMGRIFDKY
jgi:hypothetical protein